jgi:hypothetical protein
MAEWWSIEVFHGEELSARRWKDSHEKSLIEAALSNGALDWAWHEHPTGVVLEMLFSDDAQWEVFRALPAVRAALDAAPDPVNGLIIYRGRGGGAGARSPRKPRPAPGASALALGEPEEQRRLDVTEAAPPGPLPAGTAYGGSLLPAQRSRANGPGERPVYGRYLSG